VKGIYGNLLKDLNLKEERGRWAFLVLDRLYELAYAELRVIVVQKMCVRPESFQLTAC